MGRSSGRLSLMNNADQPFISIELTLFGTLFTEAEPEALPNGSSPLSLNCDYNVGSVIQRPGLQNQFVYLDLEEEKFATFGQTIPGPHAPNELPWSNPDNIKTATPGTYASVTLNASLGANFLGTSVYVSTTNSFLYNYGTAQTVSFKFSTTSTLGGIFLQANSNQFAPFVIGNHTGAAPSFAVWMNPNGTIQASYNNSSSFEFTGASALSYNDGNNHVVFVVCNAGTMTVYVDGASVASVTAAAGGSTAPCYWVIAWGPNYFTGDGFPAFAPNITAFLTNVAVWHDTIITPTQISEVHSGTITLGSLNPDSLWLLQEPLTTTVAADQQGTNAGAYQVNTPPVLFQNPFSSVYNGVMNITVLGPLAFSATGNTGVVPINIGDFIIAMVQLDPISAESTIDPCQVTSCTDSVGNTYSTLGSIATWHNPFGGRYVVMQLLFCQSTVAIPAGTSITWTMACSSITNTSSLEQFNVISVAALSGLEQANEGITVVTSMTYNNAAVATTGAGLILSLVGNANSFGQDLTGTFTDVTGASGGNSCSMWAFMAQSAGTYQSLFDGPVGSPPYQAGSLSVALGASPGRAAIPGNFIYSQILQGLNFNFAIPADVEILGMQLAIGGHQTSQDVTCILTVELTGSSSTVVLTTQLPSSDGFVTLGTTTDQWGILPFITPALVNSPNFGINVYASAIDGTEVTFDIYALGIILWLTPNPPPSINYMKTFAESDGQTYNLFLGDNGILYQEDVTNDPGFLSALFLEILPDMFAQSSTEDDREFIAISSLAAGTDQPYKYTPPNITRISQVGPGAAPTASAITSGSAIKSITQNAAVAIPITGAASFVTLSAGQTGLHQPTTPGNILTITFPRTVSIPSYVQAGMNVVLSGLPIEGGFNFNNSGAAVDPNPDNPAFYTIIQVGQPIAGQVYYNAFSVTVQQTGFAGMQLHTGTPTFQLTQATLTAEAQVPNLEVGDQLQIAGTGGAPTSGYDGTWLIQGTPNASQLDITATELLDNVAIYSYSIVTGTAPTVGQAVTVQNTTNGDGIFNVVNGIISATGSGTFSINITNANISSSSETGSAIILGTIFLFDPEAIVGNKGAVGTIVSVGVIGQGQRMVCYFFLTVDGYATQPSPILTFQVPSGASKLQIGNLLAGPPNVIARVICLTAADGGNFYYIAVPVSVVDNGVTVINTATVVNDNTSATVLLSFSDSVLLTGIQIDVQGNNLFECAELGPCTMLIPYQQRLVAVGELNKITNLINWSFDGGIEITQGNAGSGSSSGNVQNTTPAGWNQVPGSSSGASVIASPKFGFSYEITNSTGSTQAFLGEIWQSAYQDEFGVNIIEPSTPYSSRITVACTQGLAGAGGDVVLQLFSPSLNRALGTFSIPISSLTGNLAIYTGALNTAGFAPVPTDLRLYLFASNMTNGVTVLIDRVEVFPTNQPVLNQQVTLTYQGNFESFDQVTGVIFTNVQNQQPCTSAFVLFDSLYLVKLNSFISTKDNQQTEPSFWPTPRTISNSVGTPSVYGVIANTENAATGEEWALIGGYAGLYIFNGGEPIKLSEEIQSLWDFINWKYGYLLWVVNDILNRRILVGVPLNTQKTKGTVTETIPWIPSGALAAQTNASFVNAVIELNYKQLNTAGLLSERIGVRTSYSAKLIASEITRKWSIWTVQAPCAAFLKRPDASSPLFVGNSMDNGKIYELIEQLFQDDGEAIWQAYATFGFVQGQEGQQTQMGMLRYNYDYMTMIIDGEGAVTITVFPDSFDLDNAPYSHTLLPDLPLPATTSGDAELPLNECGNRLFLMFSSNAVNSGFELTRIVMVMHQDPWAPVRGYNS